MFGNDEQCLEMTNKQYSMPKRNIFCKISLQLLVFGDFDGSLLIVSYNQGWTLTIVKIWDDGMVNGFRVTPFGLDVFGIQLSAKQSI